ncbi:MAG TPA: hypothetical protein VFU31_03165 [Candidatus Binatia bacterium]|nr:hypothetical protein [Candidatus Binatia bacterium]
MPEGPSNDWKCLNVVVRDKASGEAIEYKIHLYRKSNGAYDEVRYDSHEINRGRKVAAPHFHLKLVTSFKDSKQGEEELKKIIETVVPQIREITR